MLINFVDAINDANHYTKPPPGTQEHNVHSDLNLRQLQFFSVIILT